MIGAGMQISGDVDWLPAAQQGHYVNLRRHLHQHPELGFQEVHTAGVVARELADMGLDPHTGVGRTGVVASITGTRGHSDRSVALRADMDALPITEENTFDHMSKFPGRMHGCGHDGHTAMLLAAARILMQRREDFSGTVVLIFQPGEEGHAGARAMLEDGLLKRFPFDQVFGLHNWPGLKAHHVALSPDRMMAGIDRFHIQITGKGGHGGHQDQTNDPILPMVQLAQSLQTIVSKNVSAFKEAVVSLNLVSSGTSRALSVVPQTAVIEGMTKWFDEDVRLLLQNRISDQVDGTAAGFDVTIENRHERLYPPTLNHAGEAKLVLRSAQAVVGVDRVTWGIEPSMGSEDFAYFLLERPGAFYRLGIGEDTAPLHSPKYDFNDDTLATGAALHAQIAMDALAAGSAGEQRC